jgi:hypothetical protein
VKTTNAQDFRQDLFILNELPAGERVLILRSQFRLLKLRHRFGLSIDERSFANLVVGFASLAADSIEGRI